MKSTNILSEASLPSETPGPASLLRANHCHRDLVWPSRDTPGESKEGQTPPRRQTVAYSACFGPSLLSLNAPPPRISPTAPLLLEALRSPTACHLCPCGCTPSGGLAASKVTHVQPTSSRHSPGAAAMRVTAHSPHPCQHRAGANPDRLPPHGCSVY